MCTQRPDRRAYCLGAEAEAIRLARMPQLLSIYAKDICHATIGYSCSQVAVTPPMHFQRVSHPQHQANRQRRAVNRQARIFPTNLERICIEADVDIEETIPTGYKY
jgi:hypothetical protein